MWYNLRNLSCQIWYNLRNLWLLVQSCESSVLLLTFPNCTCIGMWGFHDRQLTLRKALYLFLTENPHSKRMQKLKRRWRLQQTEVNQKVCVGKTAYSIVVDKFLFMGTNLQDKRSCFCWWILLTSHVYNWYIVYVITLSRQDVFASYWRGSRLMW